MAEVEVKEVQLIRRETKNYLPGPIVANSKIYLSSLLDGRGPLRGLEGEEETKLLSKYLSMDPKDPNFANTVRDFWAELRVLIPMEGKVLDISTDANGEPVSIFDYIIYRFAKIHPLVADNKQEMLDDSRKQFYIFNFEDHISETNKAVQFKKKAYGELIKIGNDEEKINRLVKLLSDSNPDKMNIKEKQNLLDTLIEADATKFYIMATDKELEIKYLISELVTYDIVSKYGNQYYFIDEKLGDTLEETILFFKDKKRSGEIVTMKAQLEEKKKNSV